MLKKSTAILKKLAGIGGLITREQWGLTYQSFPLDVKLMHVQML